MKIKYIPVGYFGSPQSNVMPFYIVSLKCNYLFNIKLRMNVSILSLNIHVVLPSLTC